jgi:three-Cys-motif partner protein
MGRMSKYLLPKDDGLPARTFGKWTTAKIDYLQRYIDLFETSMRNKPWCARCYLDLYSGVGKYQVEGFNGFYLSSALVALTTKHPFTHYFFADKSQENIDILTKRCDAISNINKKFYIGDANSRVQEIVKEIKSIEQSRSKTQWAALNLAFLDPDGLELEWKTIETLASVNKMDLIIYYSQSGLTRNFENCINLDTETDIDRFFGDNEWRSIYKASRQGKTSGLHRKLIDYYKQKLATLGYIDVKDVEDGAEPLMKNSKEAPLYRLIFASKHARGHDFWNKIIKKDAFGQGKLF